MQQGLIPELQSALLFETLEEVYLRVFRELKPRTKPPVIRVEYRKLANADSSVRLEDDLLLVKISDILEGAPAPVKESLAYILMGKLYRKPVARAYFQRYRLYLNRKEVRRHLQLVRQLRGRKYLSGPAGKYYDLSLIFAELNQQYFHGLLGEPRLGWSLHCSRTLLGHFDPSHNAIVISRIFDDPNIPKLALDYVMFHEMLHIQYPVDHSKTRRCVHTREFREAEKKFLYFTEAKEALKKL
jgi:hypothetical protein